MVEVTFDQKRFQTAMRKYPREMEAEMLVVLKRHHQRFRNKVQRTRMSGRPGLKAPTGTMRRGLQSGTAKVIGRGDTLAVRTMFAGPHGFFAHVHEEGMTIRTKHATIKIPARLGARKVWDSMVGELYEAANKAAGKALA